MNLLLKTWDGIGEENQALLKKSFAAGLALYIVLLVIHDLLGLNPDFTPKFVKNYAQLSAVIQNAVSEFIEEVGSQAFPAPEHSYNLKNNSLRQVKNDH